MSSCLIFMNVSLFITLFAEKTHKTTHSLHCTVHVRDLYRNPVAYVSLKNSVSYIHTHPYTYDTNIFINTLIHIILMRSTRDFVIVK